MYSGERKPERIAGLREAPAAGAIPQMEVTELRNPVNLIILDESNRILLAKRAAQDFGYRGTWSIPGGRSEVGEDYETAIHREIKEELGCDIAWFEYFRSYYVELSPELHARVVYFYAGIRGEVQPSEELLDYAWFDLDDPNLFELEFAFNQKQVVSHFVQFWKGEQHRRDASHLC